MRRRKLWLNIIAFAIFLICSAGLGTAMTADGSNELMVAVVSLGVALIALYISLRTFYSIDEVNAISRMDGNVMENPRYRPNILRAVFRFPQVGFTETSEALMSHMENIFYDKSKQSGAHLADSVQEVADMMVLVPFFIQTNNQNASAVHLQRVSSLIKMMHERVNSFKEISDGSCKLLEETVSLIDSVFSYQKLTATGDSDPSKLLEVRGSVFINPVSVILCNNYLGLYFLQRAADILSGHRKGLSLKQQIEKAVTCSADDKALAIMYAGKAEGLFRKAKESIGDDTIWRAFVCFNIARAQYMLQLLDNTCAQSSKEGWKSSINESIRNWITSNLIIKEHSSSQQQNCQISWLQQALISQENKVRLTKIVFQMKNREPLTDQNGNSWMHSYEEIIGTSFFKNIPEKDPQNRTDSLVADIRELLIKLGNTSGTRE